MKYCILLLLFTSPLSAQSFLKNFYFDFEVKNKWEFYTIPNRQQYVEIEPYNNHYAWFGTDGEKWGGMVKYFIIGYRITPKFETEIGTSREAYWGGFKYNSHDFPFADNNIGLTVDFAQNYLIRITRKFLPLKKLSINASLAYMLSKSEYWVGVPGYLNLNFPVRSSIDTSKVLYTFLHQEHRVDLGLKKYHHALEGRVAVEFQPFKFGSLYFGGGYTKGFNTFAHMRVTYWVNNEPKQTSIAHIKGSNYYWCAGFKVYPFELGIIKGMKKAVERSEAKSKQQREEAAKAKQQKKKH